jgi:hypothetical protein
MRARSLFGTWAISFPEKTKTNVGNAIATAISDNLLAIRDSIHMRTTFQKFIEESEVQKMANVASVTTLSSR